MSTDRPGARAGWALLRDPAYFGIWSTGGLTGVMRWLEILCVAIFTLEVSGSAFTVALMLFIRQAPTAILGVFAGAAADRCNRQHLLGGGLVVMALNSTVLAALGVTGNLELSHVAIGTLISGVFWAGDFPVRRTLLAGTAPPGLLGRAMAIDSATNNATRMVGPALGGLIMTHVGLHGAYLLGATLYLAAALNVLRLTLPAPVPPTTTGGLLTLVREGFTYIRSDPLIAGTLVVTLVANLFGFACASMVPVIGERDLGLEPAGIGLLLAMDGAGALVGALAIASTVRPHHYQRLYLGGTAVFLAMTLAFSFSGHFAVAAPLLLASGLGVAGFASMQTTILLARAAESMRSRLMGVMALAIGAGPIGVLHLGWLAERIGAAPAVSVVTTAGLVILALCPVIWPELRGGGRR